MMMMMSMKAVVMRPSVAGLCMVSSRRSLLLPFLRGKASAASTTTTTTTTGRQHTISSSRRLFLSSEPSMAYGRRGLCIRATSENYSEPIGSPLMKSMENKIKEQLSAESVIVKDAYGDGRHVSIYVISSAFEGQSAVNRQRMVYKAIWEELQDTVHAVDQMTTRTPSEAASAK